MKKKHLHLLFGLIIFVILPSQILALPKLLTVTDFDGTKYTLTANFDSNTYKIGDTFSMSLELTADIFGTLSGVIEAFYEIKLSIAITGVNYLQTKNTTLPDINTEGGSSTANLAFNLSDIEDDYFDVYVTYGFYGNNTQGDDPLYNGTWKARTITVKASMGIIVPILAVLSLAYVANKKWRK